MDTTREKKPVGNDWPVGSRSAHLAGRKICDGHFFGTLWGVASDREFVSNILKWPHWMNQRNCGYCPVSGDDRWDFSLNATWKANRRHCVGCHVEKYNHTFWTIVCVSRYTHLGDWAHTWDGGVLLYLHYETLNFLDESLFKGLDKKSTCRQIWIMLQDAYEKEDIREGRLQCLTVASYKRTPTKRQVHMQFAKSKKLTFALLHILKKHNIGTDVYNHLLTVYELATGMFGIIDEPGLFLEPDKADQLLDKCDRFLVHYKALSVLAGEGRFNMTNKFHQMWHICDLAKYQHPRALWTFVWESFMSVVFHMSASCSVGSPMQIVSKKTMENYSIWFNHQLKKRRE